ncbi:hypothetical protein ZWY2020_045495 [Hordeum vulgare]|nr:hypothetical protein ZWY2020_045495 [Hordeum vulgare]
MASYDAMNRQHGTLLFKLLASLLTPQSAHPMSKAADGSLIDDATVHAVVRVAFSTTTQAEEASATAHDAPLVCIEMAFVTCLMECPTQVVTNTIVNEVNDTATTLRLEPAADLIHQEVLQLTLVPPININTNTTSTAVVVDVVSYPFLPVVFVNH